MNEKIKSYVDNLFSNIKDDRQLIDIKEELLMNLNEKYEDLIESGKSEDQAFEQVVSGIGDINSLLKELGYSPGHQSSSSADGLVKKEEILFENIKDILVEGSLQTVYLRKHNGDKIIISQYTSNEIIKENLFSYKISNDKIHIGNIVDYRNSQGKPFNFFFNFKSDSNIRYDNEKLVIEIPETFSGDLDITTSSGSIKIKDDFNLNNVKLQTASGSIKSYKGLKLNDMSARTASGSIKFGDLIANGTIKLNTASGSIKSDGSIQAKNLSAMSASGNIRMTDVKVEKYKFNSASGSIKIETLSGGGQANSSSGSIKVSLNDPKGDVFFNSSSGSI